MADKIVDVSDDRCSNPSNNPSFNEIAITVSRRRLLKSGMGAATLSFFGGASTLLAGCGGSDDAVAAPPAAPAVPAETLLGFAAVATSTADTVNVPVGYQWAAILPWGDPINASSPAFDPSASQDSATQELQIGDNHDGMHFFPFNTTGDGLGTRSDEGLLAINHEYINPEYFYAPGSDADNWLLPFTAEKARKGQAGHGISVVHVRRTASGNFEHVRNSRFNRRITGYTPMTIQGPAAGNALLQTAADPTGTAVLGTLNNCANGFTPWGTYLTCEENFNGYFGWNGTRTPTAIENRYGITQSGFGYLWHTADPRFDVNANPNEPNRFGWVVEIDPFNPSSTPIKRSSMGRMKHENAELVIAGNGRVVVYNGDDERNEYIYKWVSSGSFDRANPTSAANRNLLSDGTLYVARFEAGTAAGDRAGTGSWIPLVHGQSGLTAANGFPDQASILINARAAADRVGATMMDRPEWIAANPLVAGEVYCTLTNNNRRGGTPAASNSVDGTTVAGSARPPVDEANPRSNNAWGHIIRWREAGGDASALSFTWDIFVMAGQPGVTGERAPSPTINASNLFNSPDGLAFDSFGRLWIETDGSFSNSGDFANMGNNQLLAADPRSGEIKRFLVGPSGCEITGLTFTPDRRTLFCNIQHPGEVGNHPRAPRNAAVPPATTGTVLTDNQIARNPTAFSQFPTAGQRPRSCTIVVWRSDGGPIGGATLQG
jgi:secreted PhoX family phosphatase